MRLSLFPQPELIGVDVQTNGVSFIHLKKIKAEFQVMASGRHVFSEQIFQDGKIKHWDAFLKVLVEMVQRYSLKNKPVAISLPTSLVRRQKISVPQVFTDAEIEKEIFMHIHRDLPGMTEELCMDYDVSPSAKGFLDVFFTITRKEYLLQYVNTMAAAGLLVKIIDIDLYCLERAIRFARSKDIKLPYAILRINDEAGSLIIFNHKDMIFYQQWGIKMGGDFSIEVIKQLSLYHAQSAEKITEITITAPSSLEPQLKINFSGLTFKMTYPNPFSKMIFLCDAADIEANPANFLIACGLAMREVPQW